MYFEIVDIGMTLIGLLNIDIDIIFIRMKAELRASYVIPYSNPIQHIFFFIFM